MPAPIVVAGAGPVGLSAACVLAEAGVPVVVLEAEAGLPENLRASTFHPPTLDMLARFGATERLIAQGLVAPRLQYRDRTVGKLAEFDFAAIADATRHPFRVQCEQFKLNRALLERLAAWPHVEVRFGCPVAGVERTAEGVTALVARDGRTERIEGRYLVGADGARSAVREALGIPFEGFTWPEAFHVISTPFPFERHYGDLTLVNYFADPEEWFFLLKVPGMWRCMFPARADEGEAEIRKESVMQRRLNRVLAQDAPYEIAHNTLYRVHQRIAARYRQGRAFLAGDAAHINNPLGGMGMNGGIHDAFNLAERLVEAWHAPAGGDAVEHLLDGYERQRRPVAVEYVDRITTQNKRNLETADPEEQRRFRAMLAETAADPEKTRAYMLRVSMIQSLRDAAERG